MGVSAAPFRAAVGGAVAAIVVFALASPDVRLWLLFVAPLVAAATIVVVVRRRAPAR